MAIIFKTIANASPKLLILNQDYFSNYCFFWSNLNKIKITIIFLTEMIELLHFNHISKPSFRWKKADVS